MNSLVKNKDRQGKGGSTKGRENKWNEREKIDQLKYVCL